jgi:energy-coupling factor transport system permease protein
MQDPRIRIFVVVLLSVAAFISVTGAVLAFFYWLFFTPWFTVLKRLVTVTFFLMIVIVAAFTQVMGGNGLSYFIRLTVILLLALYAYYQYRPGEFLSVSVWTFGKRYGFDPGIIAEMSMQGIYDLEFDLNRIRMAIRQKGKKFSFRNLIPVAGMVVLNQIRRAGDQADLLAVRGYTKGGIICPRFHPEARDYLSAVIAVLILILAFLPVRDIFILPH